MMQIHNDNKSKNKNRPVANNKCHADKQIRRRASTDNANDVQQLTNHIQKPQECSTACINKNKHML